MLGMEKPFEETGQRPQPLTIDFFVVEVELVSIHCALAALLTIVFPPAEDTTIEFLEYARATASVLGVWLTKLSSPASCPSMANVMLAETGIIIMPGEQPEHRVILGTTKDQIKSSLHRRDVKNSWIGRRRAFIMKQLGYARDAWGKRAAEDFIEDLRHSLDHETGQDRSIIDLISSFWVRLGEKGVAKSSMRSGRSSFGDFCETIPLGVLVNKVKGTVISSASNPV